MAGGELRGERRSDGRNFHALVDAAYRFKKVPDGKLLTVESDGAWERLVLRLQDKPAWMTAELTPLTLPAQLRQPHKVVTALAADPRLKLTPAAHKRGLRLVQALVAEAAHRGYTVAHERPAPIQSRRRQVPAHFSICVGRHAIGLGLTEEINRQQHEVTAAEERQMKRQSWYRPPRFDELPSGRLALHVLNGQQHWQSTWVESEGGPFDGQDLARVLQEAELRAQAAADAAEEARQGEIQREAQWRAAMARARERLRKHTGSRSFAPRPRLGS